MERFDVVIVGAGHGGSQAAIALRQRGFAGTVALIGAEEELPYERPQLSKEYISGAAQLLRIRPGSFWADSSIVLRSGVRITAVDPENHRIKTAGGDFIQYRKLIWATGGSPRQLSCTEGASERILYLRTRSDADAIMRELPAARDVVIIGGGYIGLEAAAVLRGLGKQVVLVEAERRLLARVTGTDISRFYETEHRSQGVDFRLGASVRSVSDTGQPRVIITIEGGECLEADLVLVGIGLEAEIGPLSGAGAAIEAGGVLIDRNCRTNLRDVYAIGDCAAHANRFAGDAVVRLESVQNAQDQAASAAADIVGTPQPYDAVPWFWSDQYDLKLQTVGVSRGFDQSILRGDPATRSFSVVYLREGRVIALDCVNAVRDYVQGRSLVASGATPSAAELADPTIALRQLATHPGK